MPPAIVPPREGSHLALPAGEQQETHRGHRQKEGSLMHPG